MYRKLKQSGQEPTHEECAQYIGLDCEMVGVGFAGKTSVLAQVCMQTLLIMLTVLVY
jgi:hypothetical protein